jgi:hypothetical protein
MRDNRFDIHQWQAEFLREGEDGGEGDEKLDEILASLNSNVANLSAVLGTMPEYIPYMTNPENPANKPEHNAVNLETAKDSLRDTGQYITSSLKMFELLKNHLKEKYNFEVK